MKQKDNLYVIVNGKLTEPDCQWYCGIHTLDGEERAVFSNIAGGIVRFSSEEEAKKHFNEKCNGKKFAFMFPPKPKEMHIMKWADFVTQWGLL